MLPKSIPQFFSQEYVPAIIGDFALVLQQEYDPDQAWLPFMVNSIMKVRAPERSSTLHGHRASHIFGRRPEGSKFARLKNEDRQIAIYVKDEEQHVLPFIEHKGIAKKEHARICSAGFPTWDRVRGNPIVIPILAQNQGQVKRWCQENCIGRYHVKQKSLHLQLEADATMAMIFWRAAK
ncbi:MAG: hypothetical protein EOO77_32155 [Oxalobacteraceae bacterium]|nr:MAG: hypothetical protein EOO77_32155 [Oxalobacteraceae bacterium]